MSSSTTLRKKLCNQYDFEVLSPSQLSDESESQILYATMMLSTEAGLPFDQLTKVGQDMVQAIAGTIPRQVELEVNARYAYRVDVNRKDLQPTDKS